MEQTVRKKSSNVVIVDSQQKFNMIEAGSYQNTTWSYEMGPLTKLNVHVDLEFEETTNIQYNLLRNNATIESLKVEMPFDGTLRVEKFTSVLKTMSRLRSLTLCFLSKVTEETDALVNDIVECKRLEELIIADYTDDENLDLTRFLQGLDQCTHLSKLSVAVNSDYTLLALGDLMRSLKTLKQVHLHLSKELSTVGSSAFTTNIPTSVSYFNANTEKYIPALKMLQSAKNLQELCLHGSCFSSKEYQQEIAEILNKCHSLRTFKVYQRDETYPMIDESVLDALQMRTSPLETLLFSCLKILKFDKALNSTKIAKFEECKFLQLKSFLTTLAENTTIETLDLIDTTITKQNCLDIKQMLQKNFTLTELNLRNQHVTTDGAKEICLGLQTNKSLLKFHMPGQMLGPSVFESINTVLQMNDTLEELTISYIFSVGELKQICTGLKSNKSLTSLHFTKHPEFDCGEVLLELLKDNFMLQKVHYKESDSVLHTQVEKMLQRNQSISEATKKDMIVLFYNIKQSTEALQLFPTEIWFQIFSQVRIPGYGCNLTAQSILLQTKQ